MKTGHSLKRWSLLAAGAVLLLTGVSVQIPVAASSLVSVTDEAQIRPLKDGSG